MPNYHKWFGMFAVVIFTQAASAQQPADLVKINGLTSISETQARGWIEAQLELATKNGVSQARADDLAFFLESALLDRGYDDAIVDWHLVGDHIELNVNEGDTIDVAGLSVTGNQALSTEAIEELLLTATRDRLRLKHDSSTPFVRNDVNKGKSRVLDLYQLLGYIDAAIEINEKVSSNGTQIVVTVTEGVKHLIGEISMPEATDPEMAKQFAAIQAAEMGQPLSPTSLSRIQTQVRETAVNLGFFNAEVEILQQSNSILETGEKSVNLLVRSNWGSLVKIDRFEVEGNKKVESKFFEKQLADIVGKPYSPQETNQTIEALLRTGAFETIRTELIKSEDGTNTLKVYVEESKTRSLGVYGGFATYEGPLVGVEFQDRNLFGSARKIDANIEFSRRGARGEIQYTDPWFLWSNYELRTSLFAFNREEEGYERFSTGGRYGLTRRFGLGGRDSFSLFGEATYTEIVESEIDTSLLGDTDYFSHFIGLALGIDRRDQKVDANRGWVFNGSIGFASEAIGSEISYSKADIGLAFYHPVGPGTFRFRAKAGAIKPLNDQGDLPIALRFFNGGQNSVRSFAERELGGFDLSTGFPVGGEFYSVITAEYMLPIQQVEGLSVIPFFDAGNLLDEASDIGFYDLRYAYGLGLQYKTLIGPLRIDYGINPDPRKGEDQGVLHIGFGSEF